MNPARAVACPLCKADPGRPCKRPSGHAVFGGGVHSSRAAAYRAELDRRAESWIEARTERNLRASGPSVGPSRFS